ncbi:TPA: hypothetical protein SMO99_002869 [Proteus mirabilis]|uniref:Uncharacterized protein n=2 Tax=Morganellaceae TaxID=1903414 RepID=A0AAI9MST4_MORMO|nr:MULTISPECIES: hypothetical protein [Providencia]EJV1663825.1 hypothetical protein [Klebsiella pneumoniae]EKW8761612.1 hypothetical protein [Morganella morganii]HEJ9425079.1 hypothetical protein [Proteus mirabilis]ELI9034783.1 hypothetical protein [Morganella morganii]ELR5252422.1 hypothetical protein [Providencia rettgeri]
MRELDLFDVLMIGGGVALLAGHYIWSKFFKKPDDDGKDYAEPPAIMSAASQSEEESEPNKRYY